MLAREFEVLQGLRSGGALGWRWERFISAPLAPFPTCSLGVGFVSGFSNQHKIRNPQFEFPNPRFLPNPCLALHFL